MIGLDTNVVVRYLAQDDPAQSARATRLTERELSERMPGFISLPVLLETCWVLTPINGKVDTRDARPAPRHRPQHPRRGSSLMSAGACADARRKPMANFLVAHGAWSAGWAWKKMRPLLRERGHELFTPTYTGLGERSHLATPDISLATHVQDVLGVLEFEDLHDVTLIGHSYGGMVATCVADRAAHRLRQLVYLDAFVPRDGQSVNDLLSQQSGTHPRDASRGAGDDWRVAPNPLPPDTSPEDVAWIVPRRVMQPRRTFEERIRLSGAESHVPKSYVYCTRTAPGDVFGPFAERARSEPGWRYYEFDASHSPHVTAPGPFAELLERIAADNPA